MPSEDIFIRDHRQARHDADHLVKTSHHMGDQLKSLQNHIHGTLEGDSGTTHDAFMQAFATYCRAYQDLADVYLALGNATLAALHHTLLADEEAGDGWRRLTGLR
jgi:hypothetical protein